MDMENFINTNEQYSIRTYKQMDIAKINSSRRSSPTGIKVSSFLYVHTLDPKLYRHERSIYYILHNDLFS